MVTASMAARGSKEGKGALLQCTTGRAAISYPPFPALASHAFLILQQSSSRLPGAHLAGNPMRPFGGQRTEPHVAGEEVHIAHDVAVLGVAALAQVDQVHLLTGMWMGRGAAW